MLTVQFQANLLFEIPDSQSEGCLHLAWCNLYLQNILLIKCGDRISNTMYICCFTVSEINECALDPRLCKYGGDLSALCLDKIAKYECQCSSAYEGDKCQICKSQWQIWFLTIYNELFWTIYSWTGTYPVNKFFCYLLMPSRTSHLFIYVWIKTNRIAEMLHSVFQISCK